MIVNKQTYLEYLEADKKALNIVYDTPFKKMIGRFFPDIIWKFQKTLRKLEYYHNCKNSGINKLYYFYLRLKFRRISIKLNFTIPINVFGPGLCIVHYGTIVINKNARIGKNCRIHACTNIGASGGEKEAPKLGDNVYIAPGAKIYGNITIPNNTAIGANAVVNKTFKEENMVLAGIPAKVIGGVDIKKLIKHI